MNINYLYNIILIIIIIFNLFFPYLNYIYEYNHVLVGDGKSII